MYCVILMYAVCAASFVDHLSGALYTEIIDQRKNFSMCMVVLGDATGKFILYRQFMSCRLFGIQTI